MLLELLDHAPLLELIDLDPRGEELEVVAGVRCELLERKGVLREAVVRHETACRDERVGSRNLERVDRACERSANLVDHANPDRLPSASVAGRRDSAHLAS